MHLLASSMNHASYNTLQYQRLCVEVSVMQIRAILEAIWYRVFTGDMKKGYPNGTLQNPILGNIMQQTLVTLWYCLSHLLSVMSPHHYPKFLPLGDQKNKSMTQRYDVMGLRRHST